MKSGHVELNFLIPTSPLMKKLDHFCSFYHNSNGLPSVPVICWQPFLIWQYGRHRDEYTSEMSKCKLWQLPYTYITLMHFLLWHSFFGGSTLQLLIIVLESQRSGPYSGVSLRHPGTALQTLFAVNYCQLGVIVLVSLWLSIDFVDEHHNFLIPKTLISTNSDHLQLFYKV